MKPEISVIVPLYNKEKFVQRSLDSILSQTFQNFEILVVDDGSTDQSADVVRRCRDPRLKVFSQPRRGPGRARNFGFQNAAGEFVAFLDADDEWMPGFLEETHDALASHPECAAALSSHFRGASREDWARRSLGIFGTPGVWRLSPKVGGRDFKRTLDFFHSGAILVRKNIVEKFGGFFDKEYCDYGEDVYLWVQMVMAYPVCWLNKPLSWYHTECAELSIFSGRSLPTPPCLTRPGFLRKGAPADYRAALERFLSFQALVDIERYLRAKQYRRIPRFLNRFSVSRHFPVRAFRGYIYLKAAKFFEGTVFQTRRLISRLRMRAGFCFAGRYQNQKVFIISVGRSGSTLLQSYLNSVPGVFLAREVLCPDYVEGWPRRPASLKSTLRHIQRSITPRRKIPIVGTKLLMYQLEFHHVEMKDLRDYFPRAKFIILYRRDLLECFASQAIGHKSGVWFPPKKNDLNGRPPVTVLESLDKLASKADRIRAFYERWVDASSPENTRLVTYEGLCADPQKVFDEVLFPFLGLPQGTRVKTDLVKIETRPPSEIFDNYDELRPVVLKGGFKQEYSL